MLRRASRYNNVFLSPSIIQWMSTNNTKSTKYLDTNETNFLNKILLEDIGDLQTPEELINSGFAYLAFRGHKFNPNPTELITTFNNARQLININKDINNYHLLQAANCGIINCLKPGNRHGRCFHAFIKGEHYINHDSCQNRDIFSHIHGKTLYNF